jgi:tripartite-type tricarboxylate transporter receptor subunit TctC
MLERPMKLFLSALAVLSLLGMPDQAQAQSVYPNQTIKFIVPNPAGGLPDTLTRIVAKRIQERLGQPAIVENRSGASSGIGTAAMLAAPADGYTFLVTDGAILSINPHLQASLPYNPKDILPVALIARAPLFLAINPKVPAKNLKELIDYARANPGKINYGSIGVGSFHHLCMEALMAAFDLKMNHVPYKGSGETVGALAGGHIDIVFAAFAGLRGAVESKSVQIIASSGAKRSPNAPDVPAISELAPGYDLAVIQGVLARTGTPDAVVNKIAAEVAEIVKEPDIIRQFAVAGIEPVGAGPADYRAALNAEIDRLAKVVRAAGLKPPSQ